MMNTIRNNHGSTIILAIFLLIALFGIAGVLQIDSLRWGNRVAASGDEIKCRYAAYAGCQTAVETLKDMLAADNTHRVLITSPKLAGDIEDDFVKFKVIADGIEELGLGITNEDAKLNIMYADKDSMMRIPGLSEHIINTIIADRQSISPRAVESYLQQQVTKGKLPAYVMKWITVWGDAAIDINAAPAEVITATLKILPSQSAQIVAYRNGADRKPFTSDDVYIGDLKLLNQPGNFDFTLNDQQLSLLKFNSAYYKIVAEGSYPTSKSASKERVVVVYDVSISPWSKVFYGYDEAPLASYMHYF